MGWVVAFFSIIAACGGMIWWDESHRPPEAVQRAQEAASTSDDLRETCVKGVVYYYTNGAHNVRFAPAVDAETLLFKRC